MSRWSFGIASVVGSLLFFYLDAFLFCSYDGGRGDLCPMVSLTSTVRGPIRGSMCSVTRDMRIIRLRAGSSLLVPCIDRLVVASRCFVVKCNGGYSLFSRSKGFIYSVTRGKDNPRRCAVLVGLLCVGGHILVASLGGGIGICSLGKGFVRSCRTLPSVFSTVCPVSSGGFVNFGTRDKKSRGRHLIFCQQSRGEKTVPCRRGCRTGEIYFFPHRTRFSSLRSGLCFGRLLGSAVFSISAMGRSLSPRCVVS